MNWPIVLILIWVTGMTVGCHKSAETDQKGIADLIGIYSGYTDNNDVVSFRIDSMGVDSFEIRDFKGITYPFVDLEGKLDGANLTIKDHDCIDCPFLPSPGGVKRFYTAHVSASGQCNTPSNDLILDIDYIQTGNYTGRYQGKIYMDKI